MGKKLAIKGHPTRGNEVIELLQMMGGNDDLSDIGLRLGGTECCCVYHIGTKGSIIYSHHSIVNDDFIVFTLEDFLEKYPFKVGDKVVYTKFGDNCDDFPVTIESMKWTGTTIEYTFNDCVTCLAKDLKMWNGEPEEPDKEKAPNLKGEDYSGKRFGYKIPDGYEFDVVVDGKIFLKPIKPKYPTTYAECCEVIGISRHDVEIDLPHPYQQKMFNLFKLRICRDAYWKIAGEEMGLDKPWEPDWNDESQKYCIRMDRNKIVNCSSSFNNRILAFPTEEMRDTFFKNFKDLIKLCKELL